MNRKSTPPKGFTLVELLVVIAIIALLIGLLLPALATAQRNARTMRDMTQIRGIHQSMLTHANENRDRMPRPGMISRSRTWIGTAGSQELAVVPGQGREHIAKNHTRHLYSAMVMMQYFNTDILISPAETNRRIEQLPDYNYDVYDPSNGVFWYGDRSPGDQPPGPGEAHNAPDDAPLTGDFAGLRIDWEGERISFSHTSYAHTALVGQRVRGHWVARSDSNIPNLSTRGPYFGEITQEASRNDPTFDQHGPRGQWEGNIAYNDNHVTTISSVYPATVTYHDAAGTPFAQAVASSDNIFDAEFTEGMAAGDAFLGIFAQEPQTWNFEDTVETAPVWDYVP